MTKTKEPEEQVTIIDPQETWEYLVPPQYTKSSQYPKLNKSQSLDANGFRRLRLSPTRMTTYDLCHAQFLEAVTGDEPNKHTIYTVVGTAAHYVLEQLNKGRLWNDLERERAFKEKMIELCDVNDVVLSFPNGYKETKLTLHNYAIPSGWRIFSCESKQVLRFAKFDFSYIADVILEHEETGEIEIRDYKTNASVPKSAAQLDYYAWATLQRHPELAGRKIRASYHMLRKDKLVYREFEPGYLESFGSLLEKQISLITKMFALEFFETTPSADACRWCPLDSCSNRFEGSSGDDGSDIALTFGRKG